MSNLNTITNINPSTITSKEGFITLCKTVAGVIDSDNIYTPEVMDQLIDLSEEWVTDFEEWEQLCCDLGWA